ncbi:DUF6924 domain-containing protein [Amycolatopsis sp. NPDC058986]|uniref:DUF6924 domain-containing protein n=1 Tax=unclassified Amycolatopsis TaxID=2618356 RepID=UPI003671BC1E
MLFAFRLWRRPWGSTAWLPEPRLLEVDAGENAVPEQLSWGTEDGAQTAIGFAPDMASCYGHRRTARGGVVEVRGERDDPSGGGRGYEFRTEIEDTHGWNPAGRLRLLVEAGSEAPLLWATWQDRAGTTCSVALRSVSRSGRADVTDLVTAVLVTDEYRDAGEVAVNLVDPSDSKWLASDSTARVEFRLTRPVAATAYVFTSANDEPGRDPAAWTLRGSADGRAWRTLDIRADQSFADRHQSTMYRIAEPGRYDRYRFDITANHGDPCLQLEAVRLLASGGGFVGYRQLAGRAPVAYRGTRLEQDRPVPGGAPRIPVGTPRLPRDSSTLLVRTDFSDDAAWTALSRQVTSPHRCGRDTFHANVVPVDDVRFEGLTAEQLLQLVPAGTDWPALFVADGTTMTSSECRVLVIGLEDDSYGQTFRATPQGVMDVENNLSMANKDWEDFADHTDGDGVVRHAVVCDPASQD